MKRKNIIIYFLVVIFIASCQKKEDTYVSKNLPIKTAFDEISSENQDKKDIVSEESQEKPKEETKNNNEENNKNKNEDNKNSNENIETITIDQELNIRSTPEIKPDNIVQVISQATEVKVLEKNIGEDNQWAKIEYNNQIYYISMEFVD